jgi:hypothetical protein
VEPLAPFLPVPAAGGNCRFVSVAPPVINVQRDHATAMRRGYQLWPTHQNGARSSIRKARNHSQRADQGRVWASVSIGPVSCKNACSQCYRQCYRQGRSNRIYLVLFGPPNRTFDPYLAAMNRILISDAPGAVRRCRHC